MSIKTQEGANLFALPVEAVVNPVNVLEGVMGKGLAKLMANRWPSILAPYKEACKNGSLAVGKVLVTPVEDKGTIKYVIHFPTKHSWRRPSELEYIKKGMPALRQALIDHDIKSIAIPGLGCGLGDLTWEEVEPVIKAGMADIEGVEIVLIPPRPVQKIGTGR